MSEEAFDAAQEALNRMRRASKRGTGCHLTAEMIACLSVTKIAEIWEQPDPRAVEKGEAEDGDRG